VASQRARERELRIDPLARGAIALLLVTALVGLALAAVGLLLTVAGDLRDDRGALFDLEAQGATPAEIRRHVLLRAGVVGALGVAAGVAAGAIVSALVVAVVTVTAGAADALPPLALVFDPRLVAAALGIVALASAGAALAATRRMR
jgi:ABC-type antimicrobial peptide transport system permease subunit